ncbi:MAG TPA: amidohydrolase, partial [Gammaproteobacteria bacterium]|nr:amidohydrolase [Gammaproteobacteria bacterium]
MSNHARCLAAWILFSVAGSAWAAPAADLVLLHGKLVTMDKEKPEAEALAVKDGRILALGSDADIQAYVGQKTQVLDLKGMTAVPGFIEGHGHFLELGDSLLQLDLTKAKDWDEVVALVAQTTKKA